MVFTLPFVFVDKGKKIIGHTIFVLIVIFLKKSIYVCLPRDNGHGFHQLIAQHFFSCWSAHADLPDSSWKLLNVGRTQERNYPKLVIFHDVGRT